MISVGKWEPVNPGDLKRGDRVKRVLGETVCTFTVGATHRPDYVGDSNQLLWGLSNPDYKWFRSKPAKPTRPAEPPAGTVVRNMVTGRVGWCDDDQTWRWYVGGVGWRNWKDWIVPGDTIEIAEWVKP